MKIFDKILWGWVVFLFSVPIMIIMLFRSEVPSEEELFRSSAIQERARKMFPGFKFSGDEDERDYDLGAVSGRMKEFRNDEYRFTFSYPEDFEMLDIEAGVLLYLMADRDSNIYSIRLMVMKLNKRIHSVTDADPREAFNDHLQDPERASFMYVPFVFSPGTDVIALRSELHIDGAVATVVRFVFDGNLFIFQYVQSDNNYKENREVAKDIFSRFVFDKEYLDELNKGSEG